jgi:hypothetical protein
MKTPRCLIPILLVLVAACTMQIGLGGGAAPAGGHFELAITHRLDAAIADAGGAPYTQSDFFAIDDGAHYLVTLDDDGRSVEVQSLTDDTLVTGRLDADLAPPADVAAGESSRYVLDTGLFAGGRLVIWSRGGALRAELTIHGSGRPVIACERGDLRLVA